MATPHQYEIDNDTIWKLGLRMQDALGAIEFHESETGTKVTVIREGLVDELQVLNAKLHECHIDMPEITEHDIAWDHYWDKSEQINSAKEYAESIEHRVRMGILTAEMNSKLDELINCMKQDEDLYEVLTDCWTARYEAEMEHRLFG